jgi:hypothetical protein
VSASLATIDAGAGIMAAPAVPLVWPPQLPMGLWSPVKPHARRSSGKPCVALEDIGPEPGPCRPTHRGANLPLPSPLVLGVAQCIDADCIHVCLTTQEGRGP